MTFSQENNKILSKLFKLKKELQAVTKGANNPFFKSKYADLNTYLDEVEPRLEADGMLLLQPVTVDALGNNVVTSIILDVESGQFFSSSMKLVGESKMQDSGSGVTYARRYTLGAMLSMQAEDDDGNKVSGKVKTTNTEAKSSVKKVSSTKSSFRTPKTPVVESGDSW